MKKRKKKYKLMKKRNKKEKLMKKRNKKEKQIGKKTKVNNLASWSQCQFTDRCKILKLQVYWTTDPFFLALQNLELRLEPGKLAALVEDYSVFHRRRVVIVQDGVQSQQGDWMAVDDGLEVTSTGRGGVGFSGRIPEHVDIAGILGGNRGPATAALHTQHIM